MSQHSLILLAVAVGIFLALLGLQVWGYLVGRRQATADTPIARDGGGIVEGAVFALLGLLLAFQFSAASGRLETRRNLSIREANAIGTAYLRLDLLEPAMTSSLQGLFRDYLETRIRTIEAKTDLKAVLQAYRETESQQQSIWSNVVILSKDKPDAVRLLLLPAVNEMIDITSERKAAGLTHAPLSLQCYLISLAMISAFIAGRAMACSEQLPRFHILVFAVVISATIFMILDMEYPRIGFIRIGAADQPVYDLREVMK